MNEIDAVAGKVVGNVASSFGGEVSNQATSLGNIAAMYILYQEARQANSQKRSAVNGSLYKLAK